MRRYRPGPEERTLYIVFAVIAGFYYLFTLHTSQGDVFTAITRFAMAVLVGYVAMLMFDATITSYLARTIAKLRAAQVKAIVREACGKEISDSEAAGLAANAKPTPAKKHGSGQKLTRQQ